MEAVYIVALVVLGIVILMKTKKKRPKGTGEADTGNTDIGTVQPEMEPDPEARLRNRENRTP